MSAVIEVRGLRNQFGRQVVHENLELDLLQGEILGVVGESGAGKSLTGAAIIGLLDPPGRVAAGEIKLGGKTLERYKELGSPPFSVETRRFPDGFWTAVAARSTPGPPSTAWCRCPSTWRATPSMRLPTPTPWTNCTPWSGYDSQHTHSL